MTQSKGGRTTHPEDGRHEREEGDHHRHAQHEADLFHIIVVVVEGEEVGREV